MKRTLHIFLALMLPVFTFADAGTFGTDAARITILRDLATTTSYKFSPPASNGDADFNGSNLANATVTNSLKITGLYVNTFQNSGDVVTGVVFYYRTYVAGSPSGVYKTYQLSVNTSSGGDNNWSRPAGPANDIELVFGLLPNTNYTLDCYFELQINTFDAALVVAGTGNYNNNSGNINQSFSNGSFPSPLPIAQTFKSNFTTAGTLSLNNINNFAAQYNQNKVSLKWDMLNSAALNTLQLQRSANGVNWQTLADYNVLNAAPNSFAFNDNSPINGLNLYRVLGVGTNGNETFSKVLRINIANIDNSLQVYPIPALTHINVLMNGIKKGIYKAFIYSSDGKRVLLSSFDHDGFVPQRRFNIPNNVQPGSYILMIQNDKEFYKQQIIKN